MSCSDVNLGRWRQERLLRGIRGPPGILQGAPTGRGGPTLKWEELDARRTILVATGEKILTEEYWETFNGEIVLVVVVSSKYERVTLVLPQGWEQCSVQVLQKFWNWKQPTWFNVLCNVMQDSYETELRLFFVANKKDTLGRVFVFAREDLTISIWRSCRRDPITT